MISKGLYFSCKIEKNKGERDFKDIDVLDVHAKTETAASSENSGRKSTENEQLEVLYEHTICTGFSQ